MKPRFDPCYGVVNDVHSADAVEPPPPNVDFMRTRRDVLRLGGGAGFIAATAGWITACDPGGVNPGTTTTTTTSTPGGDAIYGPLLAPDANGLRLPAGFTSRVIAVSGQAVGDTGYIFPANPDGAATFALPGGGWVHVVNHETDTPGGGVSRIVHDASGAIVDAGAILTGTDRNCAGGATPWNTWLSCEEVSRGVVWECDPFGVSPAVARPALGKFAHEAVAVATDGRLYLTEDKPDGALYRFTPTVSQSLDDGLLEVMTEVGGQLGWAQVPDPAGTTTSTRNQVAQPGRVDPALQRWRGDLRARRRRRVHHEGRQPGVAVHTRHQHPPGDLRRCDVADPGADGGRQHHRRPQR